MAILVGNSLVNTEEDNRYVEEWLKKQPKIKVRNTKTGEVKYMPLVTMSTKFDIVED